MSQDKEKVKSVFGKVKCAFCNGTGKDPFEIMSPFATCSVCHGLKEHHILKPFSTCAYCKGTGVARGLRNPCLSCHGIGQVSHHKGKLSVCPECNGSGAELKSNLTCLKCKGAGVV